MTKGLDRANAMPDMGVRRNGMNEPPSLDGRWDADAFDMYFGDSPSSRALLRSIAPALTHSFVTLLVGPTGSGKSTLARFIHSRSNRRHGPFVEKSLVAIPEELRHIELLGSVRGSFTGATVDRRGAIEEAHRGTLFLDELGHATKSFQQTLLTVLEASSVQRIGESRPRNVDIRFILASSTDPAVMAEQGTMLQELFYRVDGFTIHLPPLSARKDDIVPLAKLLMSKELAFLNKERHFEFSPELVALLESHPWPGNIRQLRSACRVMAVRSDGSGVLQVDDLPDNVLESAQLVPTSDMLADVHRALAQTGGNKSKAAKLLGISRGQIYRLLSGKAGNRRRRRR